MFRLSCWRLCGERQGVSPCTPEGNMQITHITLTCLWGVGAKP